MKALFTQVEFESAKSKQPLPCCCQSCDSTFYVPKNEIKKHIKNPKHRPYLYCSKACYYKSITTQKLVVCKVCNKQTRKKINQINKTRNNFCSRSCAATYNNIHKKHGTNRSKLEAYLEEQIRINYPDLELLCNDRKTIELELDFYFPSIQLAIELNGIFHYEPIYGEDKLSKIRENDERKFFKCQKANIALAIIDSSSCQNLTAKTKDKFWTITKSIVDKHLATID